MTEPSDLPNLGAFSFWQRQVDRLGPRDPLEVLAATAEELAGLLATHNDAAFLRAPFPGKWTPNQILGHLIDVEWIFGYRLRTTLADEAPQFTGVDQDAWVSAQAWNDCRPTQLAEQFRDLRSINLHFWRRLTPSDLARTGEHLGAGVHLSLGQLRRIHAGHDLVHLDQLQTYLTAPDGFA